MSDTSSARLVLAATGTWEQLPELNTRFELTLEDMEEEWREDLIQRGWELNALPKAQLKVIRGHQRVIWAELELNSAPLSADGERLEVDMSVAREAAWLLSALAEQGASALYFDPAEKVYAPEALKELPIKDSVALLHLFVDVWGDEEAVRSEGMSVFGCPDVRVVGLAPTSAEAQATAFSAAAQVACEGLSLPVGASFRASESFPLFSSEGVTLSEDEEEREAHPFGELTLRLQAQGGV